MSDEKQPNGDPRPIGVAHSWDELRDVLRARKDALGVSFETVDDVAGLTLGYSAKLFGSRHRNFGPRSLDAVLPTLGVCLIVVEDPEQLARLQSRLVKSEWRHLAGPAIGPEQTNKRRKRP
jgi:hypothetical protein